MVHETFLRADESHTHNGIAEHKDVETTMIYTHVLKEAGRASEVRRMRFESFWQKAILSGTE